MSLLLAYLKHRKIIICLTVLFKVSIGMKYNIVPTVHKKNVVGKGSFNINLVV